MCIHPDFRGNVYQNHAFCDQQLTSRPSYRKVLQWQLSRNPQKTEKTQDNFKVKVIRDRNFLSAQQDMIVWLGHACFFIRMNGVTLLTDPCLFDLPFVKRQVGLPCHPGELIGIDYILLSHGHRDHYDEKSLAQLIRQNPKAELLLPLKISTLLGKHKNKVRYQEAGWWQRFKVPQLDITFLPAKHWNRRGLFDTNHNLWGGLMLKTDTQAVYFAGDTAFAGHFEEIRKLMGAPDVCIMPVGAYKPAFMMQEAHMSPEEAVTAFNLLQGKTLLPMHYGTYDLSDEPPGEPMQILHRLQKKGKIHGTLSLPAVGEVFPLT